MTRTRTRTAAMTLGWGLALLMSGAAVAAEEATAAKAPERPLPPARTRFAAEDAKEVPDFQRHVLPLMSRLGCNGRACHGSFQGRGGFRLSLFGYDFKADHEALMAKGSGRVDTETPEGSKIIQKPTLAVPHKGGKVLEDGSWAYRMLVNWVEAGAKGVTNPSHFARLEVTPSEVVSDRAGMTVPLKVVAHWADGTTEDVTCLSRFRTNDESVAEVNAEGVLTTRGPGDTHVVAFYDNGVAVTQVIRPVSDKVGSKYPEVPTPTRIDALVVAKLRKLGIVPSEVCTDAEYLRRLRLDLTGTLPTPAEVDAFLADSRPDKRAAKADELLKTPEYAAWWATRLCDLTGDNPQMLINQVQGTQSDAARHWYAWLSKRLADNMPYDKIVEGIVLATSRPAGQSYADYVKQETAYYRSKDPADFAARETMPYFWVRRNLRTPDEKALGFSYTFLGVRLECAQCHKHPFDQWTQDDFKKFTAFFAPVGYGVSPDARKESNAMRESLGLNELKGGELQRALRKLVQEDKAVPWQEVFVNKVGRPAPVRGKKGQNGVPTKVSGPKLLGGGEVDLASYDDSRKPVMEWMRSKDNPYFARALVNRVWANYFGRGIIQPTDDLNLANPPVNPALLDHLAAGFIAHGFDLRWLHKEIVGSQTYQRSWKPNETNRLDEKNFSRAAVRRLPAEVLIDAVAQVTGTSAELAKVGTPAGVADRAIGPKGGTGVARRGGGDYASRVFGRSPRDTTCDCAASTEPNLLQSIYLQNDQELLAAVERPGGWLDERTGASTKATSAARANVEKTLAQLKTRVKELEAQLATAKEKKKDAQVKDLELQLSKRRDDIKTQKKRLAALPKVDAPPPFEADAVVREAYLRALGRTPTSDESTRARGYLRDAGDDAKGFRDLLWALLNTKEFVTNH